MKAFLIFLGFLQLAITALGQTPPPTAGITPWLVGAPNATFVNSDGFDGYLEVSQQIGSSVDTTSSDAVIVELLDAFCVANLSMSGGVVEVSTSGFSGSPFIYDVNIDQAQIGNDTTFVSFDTSDPITGTSKGSIKFCTRVTTIEGPIQVAFRETKFELKFDLTDNCVASSCFSLTGIQLAENNPDSFETLIDDDFGVEICQCSNYVCYGDPGNPGSPLPVQQDKALVLCLYPTGPLPSPVHISNFNVLFSTTTYTYEPVKFGSSTWDADVLTVVSTDSTGDTIMVTAPVTAQFYIQGFSAISVSGNCFLEFDTSKVEKLPLFANYGLEIELELESQVGCLQGLMAKLTGMFKDFKTTDILTNLKPEENLFEDVNPLGDVNLQDLNPLGDVNLQDLNPLGDVNLQDVNPFGGDLGEKLPFP